MYYVLTLTITVNSDINCKDLCTFAILGYKCGIKVLK